MRAFLTQEHIRTLCTRVQLTGIALALAVLLGALLATPAQAEPDLGLAMERIDEPVNFGDERLVYEITVKNEASKNPSADDTLTCKGTPTDGLPWSGSAPLTFKYQWLRNGTEIPGANSNTYAVQPADAGKSLQCQVTGTNDPDGAGSAYEPIGSTYVSLPPVAIEPAAGGPSGSGRPVIDSVFPATPSGTATITSGSKVLTDVVSVEGTGDLESGSNQVKNVTATLGAFESVLGQVISGPGIPAETRVTNVEETPLGSGNITLTLSNAATATASGVTLKAGAGPFGAGQRITGPGIPADTFIVCSTNFGSCGVEPIIEMSNPATASSVGAAITGHAEEVCEPPDWGAGITWSFQWLRNGEEILGATSQTYTVTSADVEPPSMLQCEAIATDGTGNEAVAVSSTLNTLPRVSAPYVYPNASGNPTTDFGNDLLGATVEVELPADPNIHAFKAVGSGWHCTKTLPQPPPATVTCSRSDVREPQSSYPPIEVVEALGLNPPLPLTTTTTATGGGTDDEPTVSDTLTSLAPAIEFGFKFFDTRVLDAAGNDYTQAGGHPFSAGAALALNTRIKAEEETGLKDVPVGSPKVIETITPKGFVGNPEAVVDTCDSFALVLAGDCPEESIVGGFSGRFETATITDSPVYAIEPEFGTPTQFAFSPLENLGYVLTPELRAEDGYTIAIATAPIPKYVPFYSGEVDLCGFGARTTAGALDGCYKAGEAGASEIPFLTNPTRCSGPPPTTRIVANSWEEPNSFKEAQSVDPALTGCELVPFEPNITLEPTSREADSPTGMDVELTMPTAGLLDPNGIAQANLANSTVTLPVGMAVNPASASGLGACTQAQLGMSGGVPDNNPANCPESSKVGSVEVETPILGEALHGNVYVAKQADNPFGSLLALYLVLESEELGITIKIAGQVTPNPANGQLVASFKENPEAPFSRLALHFTGGPQAALINPPACGTYQITSQLSPWTAADPANPSVAETVTQVSSFTVNRGPGGGPCPTGALEPKLRAEAANPTAGATTPFVLALSRDDGTQRFSGVSVKTPPGLTAYLKGIPYCPDGVLASIPAAEGTGAAELASPACPAASQVGTVTVGAGAGPNPFYVSTGKAYWAGPYKGAPVSLAVVAPAVAGPFDLGSVVVRTALQLNPETAQITAVSDPLPTILKGIPLNVRDIRINIDRPNYILNPTSCEPKTVTAEVQGEKGGFASVSDRFQVDGCANLGFKPKLKLKLKGGTKRGAYQGLTATLKARPGDANIGRTAVTLPHSAFLAQEHIRTICTRVQFAAEQCPKGSIYGKATAITPLLDYPLQGTVYLRSSNNPLPDMVMAFRGPAHQPIKLDLVGRIDSKNGGVRNTFDVVPDAPVTKFTLKLHGGKKGLIVNSRNLCKGTQRATVRMSGQNGRQHNFRPVLQNSCKKKSKGGKGKKGGKGGR
jgi:hypothetical protein